MVRASVLVVMSLGIFVLAQSSDSKDLGSGHDGIVSCLYSNDAEKCSESLKDETSLLQSLVKVEHHLKSHHQLSSENALIAHDQQALPPGWSSDIDPGTGHTFYWQDQDPAGTSTWTHPEAEANDQPLPSYQQDDQNAPPAYPGPDTYEWNGGTGRTVHWQLQGGNQDEAFVPWSNTADPTVLIINDLAKFKRLFAPGLTHLMTNGLAGCFALSIYCDMTLFPAGIRRQGVFFAHVPGLEGAKGDALFQLAKSFIHDQGFSRVSVTLGPGADTIRDHGVGYLDRTLTLFKNKLGLESLKLVEWLPAASASMGYDVERFRMYPIGGEYNTGQHRLLESDDVAAKPAAAEGVQVRRRQQVRLPLTWP